MKTLNLRILFLFFAIAILAVGAYSQTTEITYQGQLQSSSSPANGSFDFEFVLYDGSGSQIGPVLPRNGVLVANGIFSVSLDFGAGFTGATRFLEIRVRQAGGGAFNTLSPRQSVTSSPYSIKSLNAETATNATNAVNATNAAAATTAGTATNFTGNLAGDVTGTQLSTTVARIQSRNVSSTPPLDGQVLKYNGATNQWIPGTDNAGTSGGGGTITGVTPGTGLTGGGSTGNVTLNIANGGVGTNQLADNSVTDAKIVDVSGSKVTGTVANATNAVNATTATNSTQLGGIPASQYLQTNGNGSALTNLNASSITTGTLANARLGQIPTANIADGAVTSAKIASGQVVKTITSGAITLTDTVNLAAGTGITITPAGNTLTIASTGGAGGSLGGSGTPNSIPFWTNPTTLGTSLISQTASAVQLPNVVELASGANLDRITFGSPNSETGVTFSGGNRRADIKFSSGTVRMVAGFGVGPPSADNGIAVYPSGQVGVGGAFADTKLTVISAGTQTSAVTGSGTGTATGIVGTSSNGIGIRGESIANKGVYGESESNVGVQGESQTSYGVYGRSDANIGVLGQSASGSGVYGSSNSASGVTGTCINSGCIAVRTNGTSWFKGDTTPLSAANTGSGTGVAIGSSPGFGYLFAIDYGAGGAVKPLALNSPGGNVGIGPNSFTPQRTLDVFGRVRVHSIPADGASVGPVCFNQTGDLIQCSSSLRFKTNIKPFTGGMD